MQESLISCICCTYGRYDILRQAVACFLEQDYQNKELIVVNNHPVPLCIEHPQIKVYNEAKYLTLGHCRTRSLELASGEFIKIWDDDDLYLPWALTQSMENLIKTDRKLFWKPYSSWFWPNRKNMYLTQNWYEASYLVHVDIMRKYGFDREGKYENLSWCDEGIQKLEGGVPTTEMGILSHYIYRWGHFNSHVSNGLGGATVALRNKYWAEKNIDTGGGHPLERADMGRYWQQLYDHAKLIFQERDITTLKNKLQSYGYNFK